MTGKSMAVGLAVLLCGAYLTAARAAGTNAALIQATTQLTLPASGVVALKLTQINARKPPRFNVFEYSSVLNYDPERWTITLPATFTRGRVEHDTDAKLIYVEYQILRGTTVILQ